VLPAATLVASPVALIVAILVAEEVHVAVLVRFCVLLSEKVPVAVNCFVAPFAIEGLAGVTAMETSAGALGGELFEPPHPANRSAEKI
jgi:hypothetical protein